MKTYEILFAGFGGQGILFSGKFLAYDGLSLDRHVSWLPSYGPEMRGGTANCSVTLSDEPIANPIITAPGILVAMNTPSYDKYEAAVAPGGLCFVDSTLIERLPARTDITTHRLPATRMASEAGIPTLANMILVGKIMKETGLVGIERAEALLAKLIPAKKANLIELNMKAIQLGYDYKD